MSSHNALSSEDDVGGPDRGAVGQQGQGIFDTQKGGIACRPCSDSTIESNTLTHNITDGIDITGQRITVHPNTVSDAVPQGDGDTDGIRFYGNGHRITNNIIFNLSAEGYANASHPDCFETWDNNAPPTFDVVISGITCRHADSQCLIATGDQNGNSGASAGTPSIIFVDNTCMVGGAQAINLHRWPNVEIRQNKMSGPNLTRGILIAEDSTGTTVTGNTTAGGPPTVEVDNSSRPGSRVDANTPA